MGRGRTSNPNLQKKDNKEDVLPKGHQPDMNHCDYGEEKHACVRKPINISDYFRQNIIIPKSVDEIVAEDTYNASLHITISSWLSTIQLHGFSRDVLQHCRVSDNTPSPHHNEAYEWDANLIRVFDPYYDIASHQIETILEGKTNNNGQPVGPCTIQLQNGDEVYGNFRRGVRQVWFNVYIYIYIYIYIYSAKVYLHASIKNTQISFFTRAVDILVAAI